MTQIIKSSEILERLFGAGTKSLGMFEHVDGYTYDHANNKNFTDNCNQSIIHIQSFLTNLQASSKSNAVTEPFNIITDDLYASTGKTSAAQNTPKVTCDKAITACAQSLRSSTENLRATGLVYPAIIAFAIFGKSV